MKLSVLVDLNFWLKLDGGKNRALNMKTFPFSTGEISERMDII